MEGKPAALVCNAMINGLGVVRSLGQAGVPVISVDPNPLAPGLHSKYVTKAVVCPDPLHDEEAFIRCLKGVAAGEKEKPLLFPTTDPYAAAVSRYAQDLRSHFTMRSFEWEVFSSILDKESQHRIVLQAGLEAPVTYFPQDEGELLALSATLSFPLVLKPMYSHPFELRYGIKAKKVYHQDTLRREYRGYTHLGHRMFVQEYIPGETRRLVGLEVFTDAEARPVGTVLFRKLEQYPAEFGNGSLVESIDDASLLELGERLLRAFRFRGYISGIEFKIDPRDGKPKFMEINPRTPLFNGLGTRDGINLPYLAYRFALGDPLPSKQMAPPGSLWINEWRLVNLQRWPLQTCLKLIRHPRKKRAFATFSVEDPKPFLFACLLAVLYSFGLRRALGGARNRPPRASGH